MVNVFWSEWTSFTTRIVRRRSGATITRGTCNRAYSAPTAKVFSAIVARYILEQKIPNIFAAKARRGSGRHQIGENNGKISRSWGGTTKR
jgi:hypothetical protein